MAITSERLREGLQKTAVGASACFQPWTYDLPLAVRQETSHRLHRVQQLYLKCIGHFVAHYDAYRALMPVPERIAELLAMAAHKPYRPGTYRTDFVIDETNHPRLIETTCRFAMNGYFTSGFFVHSLADRFLATHPRVRRADVYSPFLDHFAGYFGSCDHVCLLKGADNRNDTRYVVAVFEAAGIPVHVIPAGEIPARTALFDGAAVLGELSHEEWCQLPDETLESILASNHMNDLRTVFLIHDKRFFALLHCEVFLKNALTPAERDELRPYVVPSYTKPLRPDLWPQARGDKDRWIIKPSNKGKSIDVFAGCVTDPGVWQALFDSGRADAMVLQEFIPQRRFHATIGDKAYHDFVVGTLLFFEDGYYGPGLFRASSHPVTNVVDDRKVAPLVTDDLQDFDSGNIL